MSLFGKILAVLNIVGAVAFVVVACMDYAKRETWAYANYVHDVALNGVTPDDKQKDYLAKETKKEWFEAAPISTQVDEVERIKAEVDGVLDKVKDDPAKHMVELARILTPFAQNYTDRERMLSIRANLASADAEAKLHQRLRAAFTKAVASCLEQGQLLDPKKPYEWTFPLNFPQAFEDACRDLGAGPDPAFEQTLRKLLPATTITTGTVTNATKDNVSFKDSAGRDQTAAVGPEVKVLIDGKTGKAEAIPAGKTTVAVVKKGDAVLRIYADSTGGLMANDPFAEALAVARNVPADPMKPNPEAHDQALTFLKALRGDDKATLRQPTDAAGAKDTLDEVYDATLTTIHEQLKAQLDDLYDQARHGPKSLDPLKTADRLRSYQPSAIARYLFNLVEALHPDAAQKGVVASPDYDRFIRVVGVAEAAQAIRDQATLLRSLGEELQTARDKERTDFAIAHQMLIAELQDRAVRLHNANQLLTDTTTLLKEQEAATADQQTKVDALEKALAVARDKTRDAMNALRDLSETLQTKRVNSRDLLGENLELYKQIRELENKR